MKANIFVVLFFALSLVACDTGKFKETPLEDFIGTWEMEGRTMFEGIKVKIHKNDKDVLVGEVLTINDNKYVKFFVEPGDIWITDIQRSSNYEFKLSEKKIGSVLFGLYGLSTTTEYNVEFIDKNTIGLGTAASDPTESKIRYARVK